LWLIDVMSVGEVNDEGLPLDMRVNTRLSRVYGLTAQLGLHNPYDNFCGWLGPFMRARSKLTESGDVSYYSQSATDVPQRALRESSEGSNGERENDALSKAL
jgi:hypothetical protein